MVTNYRYESKKGHWRLETMNVGSEDNMRRTSNGGEKKSSDGKSVKFSRQMISDVSSLC